MQYGHLVGDGGAKQDEHLASRVEREGDARVEIERLKHRRKWDVAKAALVGGLVGVLAGMGACGLYNRPDSVQAIDMDGKPGLELRYDPQPFPKVQGKGPITFTYTGQGGVYTRDGQPLPERVAPQNYVPSNGPLPR